MPPPRIWAETRKRVFRYRRQEFFAENGLIHVIDKDTGEYTCVSVVEFAQRAKAFSQEAWRMRKKKMWADERDEMTRMVEDMYVCCEQARKQGDPFDPIVLAHMTGRRSSRVVVPNPDAPPQRSRRIIVTGR